MVCRWYFPDTKRLDAEKMLLSEGNQHGAFLIRNCESQKGELSLSGNSSSNGHCFMCAVRFVRLCVIAEAKGTTKFVLLCVAFGALFNNCQLFKTNFN